MSQKKPAQYLNRWPRAFARVGDLALFVFLWALVARFFDVNLFEMLNPVEPLTYLILFLVLPLALLLDAIVAGLFGNTPVKAFVGVRPGNVRGERLSLRTYLKRNYGVWTDGLGLGIPPLTLITLLKQFRRISGRREAIYDDRAHIRVHSKGNNTKRVIFFYTTCLAAVLLLFGADRLGVSSVIGSSIELTGVTSGDPSAVSEKVPRAGRDDLQQITTQPINPGKDNTIVETAVIEANPLQRETPDEFDEVKTAGSETRLPSVSFRRVPGRLSAEDYVGWFPMSDATSYSVSLRKESQIIYETQEIVNSYRLHKVPAAVYQLTVIAVDRSGSLGIPSILNVNVAEIDLSVDGVKLESIQTDGKYFISPQNLSDATAQYEVQLSPSSDFLEVSSIDVDGDGGMIARVGDSPIYARARLLVNQSSVGKFGPTLLLPPR